MRLIDADALIDEVDGDLLDSIAEGRAIEKIMNAPTIEERKKGKWIGHSIKKGIEEWQSAKCSVCGRYHTTPFLYYFDAFKYCPNCGSYNGGGDDEADRR